MLKRIPTVSLFFLVAVSKSLNCTSSAVACATLSAETTISCKSSTSQMSTTSHSATVVAATGNRDRQSALECCFVFLLLNFKRKLPQGNRVVLHTHCEIRRQCFWRQENLHQRFMVRIQCKLVPVKILMKFLNSKNEMAYASIWEYSCWVLESVCDA